MESWLTRRRSNHDGGHQLAHRDIFDYLDFVQVFSVLDPNSDFNADGVVDLFDYLDFVNAFSGGC